MSLKRNKEKTTRWRTWIQEHRDELLACGIPPMVTEDMSRWYYFLDHGYFTPVGSAEPIINVDRMSKGEVQRLCLFLERDDFYPGCHTLNRLQYLLRRGPHAETRA